jgi:hypothetical protein
VTFHKIFLLYFVCIFVFFLYLFACIFLYFVQEVFKLSIVSKREYRVARSSKYTRKNPWKKKHGIITCHFPGNWRLFSSANKKTFFTANFRFLWTKRNSRYYFLFLWALFFISLVVRHECWTSNNEWLNKEIRQPYCSIKVHFITSPWLSILQVLLVSKK